MGGRDLWNFRPGSSKSRDIREKKIGLFAEACRVTNGGGVTSIIKSPMCTRGRPWSGSAKKTEEAQRGATRDTAKAHPWPKKKGMWSRDRSSMAQGALRLRGPHWFAKLKDERNTKSPHGGRSREARHGRTW